MVRRFDSKGYDIRYLERRFPDKLNFKKTYPDMIKQVGIDRLEDLSLGERHDLLMDEWNRRISEVAQQAKLEDTVGRLEQESVRTKNCIGLLICVATAALMGYMIYTSDSCSTIVKFRNQVEGTYHSIIEDTNAFLRENK